MNFALLFHLDVGTGGRPDGIDVASGTAYDPGDGVHRDLNLLAFHYGGRLALLNGTLADDLLPALLALHRGPGWHRAARQHGTTHRLASSARAARLLGGTGRFLLLFAVVVRSSFAVRMILLQVAVEGGRFAGVMIFLLDGSCRHCPFVVNDDRFTVPLLLLLLLGIVRLLRLRLLMRMLMVLMVVILFRIVLLSRGGFLRSHVLLFDGFLPLVAVLVVQLLLKLVLMTTLQLLLQLIPFPL